jgi:hypothetical protein
MSGKKLLQKWTMQTSLCLSSSVRDVEKTLKAAYRRTADHNNKTGYSVSFTAILACHLQHVFLLLRNERRQCDFYVEFHALMGGQPDCEPVRTLSSSSSGSSISATSLRQKTNSSPDEVHESGGIHHERNDDDDDDDHDSVTPPPRKKSRTILRKATTSRSAKDQMLSLMKESEETRANEETRRVDLLERMHNDKMQIMTSLVDVLKAVSSKMKDDKSTDC